MHIYQTQFTITELFCSFLSLSFYSNLEEECSLPGSESLQLAGESSCQSVGAAPKMDYMAASGGTDAKAGNPGSSRSLQF